MDAVNEKILSRLLKKLSALRITLSDEERNLLDQIMIGEGEVEAHRFETGKITAKSTAKSTAKATDADEVEAHRFETGKITAKSTAKSTAKATDADEVEAHRFETGKITAKSTAKSTAKATDADEVEAHGMFQTEAPSVRIVFDPTENEYKLG